MGAWTPHGVGWPALWTGLLEGRHAFEPVGDDFGPDPRLLAGRIRDLQPFRDAFPSVKPPLPISVTRMAMVAAQQALAGLDPALRSNYGVMLNRSRGPARVVADIMKPVLAGGPRKTSPLLFSQSVANAPLGAIATAFGLRGPHLLTLGGGAIMVAFALGVSTLILGLAYGAKSALRRRQTLLRSLAERSKPIMGVVFILVGTALWFRLNHVVEAWLIDTLPPWLIDFSVSL